MLEARVGQLLRSSDMTLAVAESCTGGMVGDRLTNVPGSSDYLLLDVVAYSNSSKESVLGVSRDTLLTHGAVSEATVVEMAEGVREVSNADVGAAVTGIAGPGGATAIKSVGSIHFAVSIRGDVVTDHRVFPGDWSSIKRAATEHLLNILALALDGARQA